MNDNPQRFAGRPVPQSRTRAWVMLGVSLAILAFLVWAVAMGGADDGAATVVQFVAAFALAALLGWRALIALRRPRSGSPG
ncbi:hypothetical protein [Streptomyces zingiberis]|uniref:Uncharacterized protein n=1 Tax=Streptomyces zingiberis TaxID=2053010 RepID=A0ABX1BMZ2_9ACTN|nr:hypothetical protein [Streptomyces zingiberis]NJP99105.1 hypothetical protein [Streptomyces zingiberis]